MIASKFVKTSFTRLAASTRQSFSKPTSRRGLVALTTLTAVAIPSGFVYFRPSISLDSQAHPVKMTPETTHPETRVLSRSEVSDHKSPSDGGLWVIIDNAVYDVSNFLDQHPGGSGIIESNAGKDVTKLFKPIHPPNTIGTHLGQGVEKVGDCEPMGEEEAKSLMTDEEKRISEARSKLGHVDTVVNLDDFERVCKDILSKKALAYYSSGSDDEGTIRSNVSSFSRILFKPRVLRKVKDVSIETTILGHPSSSPIYISPAALARLGNEDGEMNLTKGAAQTGIIQVISSNASCSLDEMCDVRKENQPLFWQYYVNANRDLAYKALQNALDHKMNSIWVTVDAPVGGKREADLRVQLEENPPTNESSGKGGSTSEQMFSFVDPNLSWEDLKWMKERAPDVSFVIKGIGSVEDAVMAIEAGMNGIVISNHGGRQLNGGIPPIRILERLTTQHADLLAKHKTEIFLDGGIRRGTDVLKALCLGATAVGLGRTFLYAQSAWGTEGVVKAVEVMNDEIKLGMRLLGVTSLTELGPEYIEVLPM
ncbi:l-mandelate dehydrogenase [Phaffia rhodozyma]|uniref:L-lactate dehydrogenase (cytochrome) n=1 Tax=Phaffia rhodozyma TaxID=264483 RepID=A0A0F7SRZ6_PHARH|nr:l-mandelate dehydrogenase [Phaffia rhodozyma]